MTSSPSTDTLIIGAGAAGLMAARELTRYRRVAVLEGRARCGGRIFPLPASDFGYPAEAGAEYIHGAAPLTRALLREAGLSVVPVTGRRWSLQDGAWVPREAAPHEERFLAAMKELAADLPVAEFVARHFSGPEYAALRQLVLREVEGYNNADPRRFSTFALRDQWLDPDAERQERVAAGYGALVAFLAAQAQGQGAALHLNAEVTAIAVEGGQVLARCRDGRVFAGSDAILTAPLPVLRTLALPSPLAERIAAADDAVGFGNVVKLHLRFHQRWWTQARGAEPGFSDLGFVFGAHVAVPVWWTQYPAEHPVLTGWTPAHKVAAAAARTSDEWLALALASLAALFERPADRLRRELVASHVTIWGDDRFARGAYSYPTLATPAALAALREAARGPLRLAGETLYAEGETGTVEAALASGREAAQSVLKGPS
jgi:monoamine oxidase